MSGKCYDIIVVGGGPGGYSAAIAAAKEGQSVLLFEGEAIGGTCLNVGCIPTKYLLDKAAALEKIRSLAGKKILEEAGYYSFRKIQEGREAVVKKLVSGVEYLLKANHVEVIRKNARFETPGQVTCDGQIYEGKNIILATGSQSSRIPIPGAEYAITSTEALSLEKVPKKLTVIGGGVIGMELASAFHSFGSEVTVIEVLPELFPAEDRKAVNYLSKELKKRGLKILCKTAVKEIKKTLDGYLVAYEGEESGEISADVVLMATGRKARLSGIDVEALGLELTGTKEIRTDCHMQTNLPHVYAMPAFAAVGMGEEKAREEGIQPAAGEFSYVGNGMALAEGAEGLVRVIMDQEKKETIGVQIVGEGAPELILSASLAVKNRMTLEEWESMIVAHPSLSEMIKEAALDCFGKSIHGNVR